MTIKKVENLVLERAREGDHEAFRAIFEEYGRPIAGYLYRLLGDKEAASDLAQETFLKAYRAILKVPPAELQHNFNLSAWLFTIAHHNAMDYLRRHKRQGSPVSLFGWLETRAGQGGTGALDEVALEPVIGSNISGETSLEQLALSDGVERALAKISADYAACLILHYHHGFSYVEAATVLELPLTTFKMRLYRARQAFQQAYLQENAPIAPATPKVAKNGKAIRQA